MLNTNMPIHMHNIAWLACAYKICYCNEQIFEALFTLEKKQTLVNIAVQAEVIFPLHDECVCMSWNAENLLATEWYFCSQFLHSLMHIQNVHRPVSVGVNNCDDHLWFIFISVILTCTSWKHIQLKISIQELFFIRLFLINVRS